MQKIIHLLIIILFSLSFSSIALAKKHRPIVNKIIYQVQAEEWVDSQTAKVIVALNASLDQQGLNEVRNNMQVKLKKIIPNVTWRIIRFDQSKNQADLESVNAQAEARVPTSELSSLRDKAKAVSKPGEKYTIASIDYSPSMDDIQKTRATVREKIYTKVQTELAQVNKTYPKEVYFVHRIDFSPIATLLGARPVMAMKAAPEKAGSMTVSDKIILTARVTLGSIIPNTPSNKS